MPEQHTEAVPDQPGAVHAVRNIDFSVAVEIAQLEQVRYVAALRHVASSGHCIELRTLEGAVAVAEQHVHRLARVGEERLQHYKVELAILVEIACRDILSLPFGGLDRHC